MSEHRAPSFDDLPAITTMSILSYVSSRDWLNFRVASLRCYEAVHDTANVWHTSPDRADARADMLTDDASGDASIGSDSGERNGGGASEALWRLALTRDYQFDASGGDGDARDEECLMSIRSPALDPNANDDGDDDDEPFLATGNMFTAPNAFTSWKHWRRIDLRFGGMSGTISGPFFLRACRMWKRIEDWCDRSGMFGRHVRFSLLPGRPLYVPRRESNSELSAFRAVYAFYAGQDDTAVPRYVTGLFGGFQAYDVISNSRWMRPNFYDSQDFVVISQCSMKVIAMEISTGQMYSISRRNPNLVATPCPGGVHRRSISLGLLNEIPVDVADGKDSILRWFEEHARRLHRDYYAVGILNPEDDDDGNDHADARRSLLKYPTAYDTTNCSRAVTRGLEIVASAIFVEEMGMFVYSIRMRLLIPDDDGNGYMTPEMRGFDTCQLVSRHWRISKSPSDGGSPVVDEVRGEGVIGYFPILCDGAYVRIFGNMQYHGRARGAFSYQSCTEADCTGSIEGYLQFKPMWRDDRPNGDIFNARVDPFPLTFSQFLY